MRKTPSSNPREFAKNKKIWEHIGPQGTKKGGKMRVALHEHLTGKKIFFAVIAPICMMVFSSLYTLVDGVFMASFVGSDAFAGNNLVWPYFAILASPGFMFGSGGAALVGKYLGQKRDDKANRSFSFLLLAVLVTGIVLGLIGFFTMSFYAKKMALLSDHPTQAMVDYGITYGRILSIGMPAFMLQLFFQSFFSTAEKPYTGFLFTVVAGLANIGLDALFMGLLGWEVEGAAIATVIGYTIAGFGPIVYFLVSKKTPIRLGKAEFDGRILAKSASNGISELISNVSSSILAICYNVQLLRYIGPVGVSAYGIILYFAYTFNAVFIGYAIGVSPFIAYQFGAQNKKELRHILKRSLCLIAIIGAIMFLLSEFAGPYLSIAFASGNEELASLASYATRIYSFVFLFCGFSMFGSAFFTALNNGLVSGIIAVVRALVLEMLAIFLLPLLLSVDGIWSASVFAEFGAAIMTAVLLITERKKYGY